MFLNDAVGGEARTLTHPNRWRTSGPRFGVAGAKGGTNGSLSNCTRVVAGNMSVVRHMVRQLLNLTIPNSPGNTGKGERGQALESTVVSLISW
jgi:hypothetical protein